MIELMNDTRTRTVEVRVDISQVIFCLCPSQSRQVMINHHQALISTYPKKQEAGMLHIDIIQCGMQQTYMDLQGGAP